MAQEPNRIEEPYTRETDEEKLMNAPDDVDLDSYGLDDDNETDETAETKAIREDIVITRSQMSETIDAIQEKLSFANISGQVKEEVSGQISSAFTSARDEVSEQISSVISSAKDSVYGVTRKAGRFMKNAEDGLRGINLGGNILPFALIGTGIALVVMNNKRKSADRYGKYRVKGRYDQHLESAGESGGTFDSARQKAGDAAGSLATSVRGAADTAYRAIGDGTSAISETVSTLGGKSRDQYEHYMDVNPLAVGAVAAAVGAIVGLSIPRTQYEGELMGEASKKLMSQVQGTAKDALSKVQDVAEKAAGAITDTGGEKGASEKSQGAPNRM
ncbi:MAG: DUF3618 domain-containing protein [Pyrinomonadaceae bacterium]